MFEVAGMGVVSLRVATFIYWRQMETWWSPRGPSGVGGDYEGCVEGGVKGGYGLKGFSLLWGILSRGCFGK